jgi:hypothetical protein
MVSFSLDSHPFTQGWLVIIVGEGFYSKIIWHSLTNRDFHSSVIGVSKLPMFEVEEFRCL